MYKNEKYILLHLKTKKPQKINLGFKNLKFNVIFFSKLFK